MEQWVWWSCLGYQLGFVLVGVCVATYVEYGTCRSRTGLFNVVDAVDVD